MFSSGNDPNGTVLPIQLQRNYHLLPDKLPDCSVFVLCTLLTHWIESSKDIGKKLEMEMR